MREGECSSGSGGGNEPAALLTPFPIEGSELGILEVAEPRENGEMPPPRLSLGESGTRSTGPSR